MREPLVDAFPVAPRGATRGLLCARVNGLHRRPTPMTTPPSAKERAMPDQQDNALDFMRKHHRYGVEDHGDCLPCHLFSAITSLQRLQADALAQAVQARDEEWDQREGAEHCPACHGRLPDRMAMHLQAEVAESERVKQLTHAFETALRWVHPLHRDRIADLAALRARPAEPAGRGKCDCGEVIGHAPPCDDW